MLIYFLTRKHFTNLVAELCNSLNTLTVANYIETEMQSFCHSATRTLTNETKHYRFRKTGSTLGSVDSAQV